MKRTLVCAVLLLAAACFAGRAESTKSGDLRVRRGPFTLDVVLSGELEAARGDFLTVPPMPSWQTAIKWIVEDGATVKAGDQVVELDNSALTVDLDTKRRTAIETAQELQQKEAEWSADVEQKQLEVDKKKGDLEKARVEAEVPREFLSLRDYETKQTAFRRATNEYEKALDVLQSRRTGIAAERANVLLRIEKAGREIAIAEEAIAALVLTAPKDGIVVVRDHFEGRKLQSGDNVFVGMPIAMLPDLDSLRVKAALADVDDGKIAVGMPVRVTMDGFPDIPFTGRITAISAVAQESRRQSLRRHFDVIVDFDRLDRERMRPGLSARVVVQAVAAKDAVLLAPRAAIDFSQKNPRARVARGGMKDVTVGACNAQECVVRGGLTEGEQLVPVIEARAEADRG